MVNFELLLEKIKKSGMTITAITRKCNISRETYYNRINGIGDFTASEICALTKVLNLSRDERDIIFFDNEVN